MIISYFDESGDDGYPNTSSQLFVLSSIYMREVNWQPNYKIIHDFRKYLKQTYGIPVKQEFHTMQFITDKNPYHGKYNPTIRKAVLSDFCNMAINLKMKIISVVIDKNKINRPSYDVLENALKYNIQRIENHLNKIGYKSKFMIITDEGRVGKMKKTSRAMQKINYIPSKFYGAQQQIPNLITNLIEDPLPKDSSESYFIQLADLISFIVHIYARQNLCSPTIAWGKRILGTLNYGDEIKLMDTLIPVFNTAANAKNKYGIVYYPK